MRPDDDSPWTRQLVVGLGALVAISLLVGGVVGAVVLGAAKISGIENTAGGPSQQPSLFIPSHRPTTTPEAFPDPTGGASPTATPSGSDQPTEPESSDSSPKRKVKPITLQAFPNDVAPGERINLTGLYRRGEGATLKVQRFEGGWQDFADVTATVRGGIYETYVLTGRSGLQRFRMVDAETGKTSNPARIRVG